MGNNNSLLAFLFGAATGAAVTYFLLSDKTAEVREKLKAKAEEEILEGLDKAEEILENI